MTTPAKNRFMDHIYEIVHALEFNCLQLSQDIPKFGSKYLTHTTKITTGVIERIRMHLIVNEAELKNSLPKGVLRHGEKRPKKGKRAKG